MNKNQSLDEKLLHILDENPQKGMSLLMEQYFGLIWTIISRHLSNLEDIKECVNDTFTQFYFNRKHYDSEKSSLAVYLSAIAHNQAISFYRKEKKHEAEVLPSEYAYEDKELYLAEVRTDIQRALDTLKEEDSELIRMKYYGGMTIQEIADSLHLPYETVKKRHYRLIKKLGNILFLVLLCLLASITAYCAYQ